MKKTSKKEEGQKKKGPVIPAGTEQETGLTRGLTKKPPFKKSKSKESRNGEKLPPAL